MDATIIAALIAAGPSLIGSFAGVMASSKLTAYRIEQLEEKVNKHNSIIDRTYKLEEQASVMNEKIAVANHRIEDLERKAEA